MLLNFEISAAKASPVNKMPEALCTCRALAALNGEVSFTQSASNCGADRESAQWEAKGAVSACCRSARTAAQSAAAAALHNNTTEVRRHAVSMQAASSDKTFVHSWLNSVLGRRREVLDAPASNLAPPRCRSCQR